MRARLQGFRRRHVGADHELLDQPVAVEPLARRDRHTPPRRPARPAAPAVQFQRAAPGAGGVQDFVGLV